MSSDHDDAQNDAPRSVLGTWDPADGPEPSADELRDAAVLARALDAKVVSRDAAASEVRDALETALRARAAVQSPGPDASARDAAKRAVGEALETQRASRFLSGRGRWLAIAAAGIFAVGGAGLLSARARLEVPSRAAALDEGPGISRPAGLEAFDAPLPERPGARVMDRLADARMRAYRDRVLLYGAARRAR